MTPEHVLDLADQAGLWYPMGGSPEALHGRERLFAFALLIEAAKCERIANLLAALDALIVGDEDQSLEDAMFDAARDAVALARAA